MKVHLLSRSNHPRALPTAVLLRLQAAQLKTREGDALYNLIEDILAERERIESECGDDLPY